MAQKLITICDAHLEEHPAAAQAPISLDAGRTFYATDLCEQAAKELIAPLREFLAEHGRTLTAEEAERARPRIGKKRGPKPSSNIEGGSWPCPVCGDGPMARPSLRKHMPSFHGRTLAQLEAELGQTVDGREVKHYCDQCGGGFAEERGVSVHLRGGCPDRPVSAKKKATKKKA